VRRRGWGCDENTSVRNIGLHGIIAGCNMRGSCRATASLPCGSFALSWRPTACRRSADTFPCIGFELLTRSLPCIVAALTATCATFGHLQAVGYTATCETPYPTEHVKCKGGDKRIFNFRALNSKRAPQTHLYCHMHADSLRPIRF
jgi:hypothetical protein